MSVKLILTGRRRAGQTLAAHRHHMRDVHGQIVLAYIAADPERAPRRYVQNHVLKANLGADARSCDFVTELWFPDAAAIAASRQTDFYRDHLLPDEPNMVDPDSVTAIVTHELSAPSEPALGFKVFFLHRAAPGLSRPAFNAGWSALDTAWPRSRSHVLTPGPFDGVDALRLASAAAAADFVAGEGQLWLNRLSTDGLIANGGSDVLIAQEFVLFEGRKAAPVKGNLE